MLGNLIGGFITILVGVNLVPTVADLSFSARFRDSVNATNVTGVAATFVNLVTLFFVLGVAAAGIAVAAKGLRESGML